MKLRRTIAATIVGAAFAIGSTAGATPILTITNALQANQEVTGDAGGTSYPWAGGPGGGAGLPSANGGWPTGAGYPPGFGPDPSFGNALGTTGYHSGYLSLSQAANVTFQFMGAGNSALANLFIQGLNVFTDGVTSPCKVSGAVVPKYQCSTVGPNPSQVTVFLNAGLIPFMFTTGHGVNVINDGVNNYDPHTQNLPGFFLGVDPYLATGTFDTSGKAVFAGLADRPAQADHDFQDMGVRISVGIPEPGTLALLGLGLVGLGLGRRRK